jgi:Rps23 Pro-64 3,4-dihydroxylase Tpa1-like proline 4-hydroxylase
MKFKEKTSDLLWKLMLNRCSIVSCSTILWSCYLLEKTQQFSLELKIPYTLFSSLMNMSNNQNKSINELIIDILDKYIYNSGYLKISENIELDKTNPSEVQENDLLLTDISLDNLDEIISSVTEKMLPEGIQNTVNLDVVKQLTFNLLSNSLINVESTPREVVVKEISEANPPLGNNIIPSFWLQINDFFTPEEYENLLAFTITKESKFVPTTTMNKDDKIYRRSLVLYYYDFPEFYELILNKVQKILPEILTKINYPEFSLGEIECQLTAHNDNHYYKVHQDNATQELASRELSYVYYFYRLPKNFSGGELKLYNTKIDNNISCPAETYHTIEPINNSLVLFPSSYHHEILPVKCTSHKFADSRFTLNGWINKNV